MYKCWYQVQSLHAYDYMRKTTCIRKTIFQFNNQHFCLFIYLSSQIIVSFNITLHHATTRYIISYGVIMHSIPQHHATSYGVMMHYIT